MLLGSSAPRLLGSLIFVWMFVDDALANCPNGLSTTSCRSICSATGSTFACDTDVAGSSTQGAYAWMVYDYNPGLISAWGTDNTGGAFCCEIAGSSISIASLSGADLQDDTLFFTWQYLNLTNASGYTLAGTMNGLGGDDLLTGSDSTSSSYTETLNGDKGCETIYGLNGNDNINGGDSVCEGSSGHINYDVLYGGGGSDVIHGGDGKDEIYGGDGDDALWGGDDPDGLCGESGDDTLYGMGGLDTLWGGDGLDTNIGGPLNDKCGSAFVEFTCEIPITTNPGCEN